MAISCVPGKLAYYEGEMPGDRYVLHRPNVGPTSRRTEQPLARAFADALWSSGARLSAGGFWLSAAVGQLIVRRDGHAGGVDKIMFTESWEGQADFSGHKFVGPRRHVISEVMPCPNGNDSVPMILWLRRVRGDEFSPNQAVQSASWPPATCKLPVLPPRPLLSCACYGPRGAGQKALSEEENGSDCSDFVKL